MQARKPGDLQILQLIPRSILLDDFPIELIDNYVHWLDLNTGELEFRPARSLWTPETSNWRLYIDTPGVHPRSMLQKKPGQRISSRQLIDIRSSTFGAVSSLLSRVESPNHITVTYVAAQALEVSLPRYRLSFFVNTNWELECRSMPGYVIDETQTCGTMFGLTNKLILRPNTIGSEGSILPRRVIIPQGVISFRKNEDFTDVSINIDAEQHVRWHEYTIDTTLGCLTSNTSLSSKLYQCYLHALTSHCLPDPLLGQTGTEEALHILQSTFCRSFQRLDDHDAKLLGLIGKLTPDRAYYPPHLLSMAMVKWNDLPALSQHHDFFRIVCSLFDHARALEVLYDPPTVFNTPYRNQSLLRRAASRNKSYYPADLQISEQPSSPEDVIYRSRDLSDLGDAEHVAFQTSWSIWNARPSLDSKSPDLWDVMNSWGSLGPSDGEVSLRYGRYWLEFDIARDWFIIYDLCREAVKQEGQNSKIKLCFSLSAAAYSKSKYSDFVPFLVIFSVDERCCDLNSPPRYSYTLSDGLAPTLAHLKTLVFQSALPIQFTPAHSLQVKMKKKKAEYNATITKESTRVAESILCQWPSYEHANLADEWFDDSDFSRRINKYIQSISRNIKLRDHALQLQGVLKHWQNGNTNFIVTALQRLFSTRPNTVQYTFSPIFTTSHSKVPSYSLHDILVSRTNIPSAPTREGIPLRLGPDAESLETLIGELRHSEQPLQELYGNDLHKSHSELLRQHASHLGRGALPSHQLLLIYHDQCSRRTDSIFSDISAALAPYQNVEKTNSAANLWPRITPRYLLGQLARDRVNKLPDQWRSVIMRYATCLLKKRHSLRMLELSSEQKHEELLRETEAIRDDVVAESTPDWLLVQVRP